jgi:hypothetical protein
LRCIWLDDKNRCEVYLRRMSQTRAIEGTEAADKSVNRGPAR